MGCRVGITTRPEERPHEWAHLYRNFRDCAMAGPFASRAAAQDLENYIAANCGCEAHRGGDEPHVPGRPWYVYRFSHDGRK
jgi:hypothetical protein